MVRLRWQLPDQRPSLAIPAWPSTQMTRYQEWIGKTITVEGVNGPFEVRVVVADEMVDPEFGTGVVKITPAHSFDDWGGSPTPQFAARAGYKSRRHYESSRWAVCRFVGVRGPQTSSRGHGQKGLLVKTDSDYETRVGSATSAARSLSPC